MNNLAFFKGKKVFLTGHTGFKGSWLSRILILSGAEVTGYALEAPVEAKLFDTLHLEKNMHSVIGDIRDREKLIRTMQEAQPEIVFHLAAQPIVRESYKDPVGTYETNVMGTVNILEAVRQTKSVKSFLNVTTDKVYKNNEWEWGYREIDELDGYDPYSNSKSCSELVTHSYEKSFLKEAGVAVSTASGQCDRRRRFRSGPDHPGLRAGSRKRRKNSGTESTFHKTVSACAGTAWCVSDDRAGTV